MTFNTLDSSAAAENDWFKSSGEGPKCGAVEVVDLSKKAGFWVRTLAFFIDNVILNLTYAIFFITGGLAVYLASGKQGLLILLDQAMALTIPCNLIMLGITIGYFTYFHGSTGQTIGKMICQLKVVEEGGGSLSYGKSFIRWVGYLLSTIILNIGFLWVAFDKNKQGWHDKIARTYVIRLSNKTA